MCGDPIPAEVEEAAAAELEADTLGALSKLLR